MSVVSVTTTAQDALLSGDNLTALAFKNGSASGKLFLRNRQQKQNTVTSSDYEWSLGAGEALGLSSNIDGEGIIGPWQVISDTVGGVTLEILALYKKATRAR